MKITILTYLENEKSKSCDMVVEQVAGALKEVGHRVSILGVHDDLQKLIGGLRRRKTDLVFNLMEMFGNDVFGDVGVVGVLELLKIPYTGAGPGECYLQQDKVLTKKLLAFDHILYPNFALFYPRADFETGGNLHMPLFVKPLRCDASIGIDGNSLVQNSTDLMKRVAMIHQKVGDSALAEEFISGREFFVGVLGNQEPQAFPPIEVDYSGMPADKPHILDARAKWKENSAEYKGTRSVLADVPDELRARLQQVSLDAYRALRVRDYGRVDLRYTETGDIYVIEVNANCYLERSSEFATAAAAAGLDYPALVGRIAELGFERKKQRSRLKAS